MRRMQIALMTCWVVVLAVFPGAGALMAESTISCPPGKVDILDWLTLDSNLRGTKHMQGMYGQAGPIYTLLWPDKYFWIKTSSGDTMDINLYDSSFVYLWYTELDWHSPFDYRKHTYDFNMPMAPRCATPGYPGSTITVTNSSYSVYQSCSLTGVYDLNRVVFEVWGPYTAGQPGLEAWREPIGGDVPNATEVYVLSYRYDCNSQFNNCNYKEEYVLTKKWGLVRWEYFERQPNGQYKSIQKPTFNDLVSGTASPYVPCLAQSFADPESEGLADAAECQGAWEGAEPLQKDRSGSERLGSDREHPFSTRFSPRAPEDAIGASIPEPSNPTSLGDAEPQSDVPARTLPYPACRNFGPGREIQYVGPDVRGPFAQRFGELVRPAGHREE